MGVRALASLLAEWLKLDHHASDGGVDLGQAVRGFGKAEQDEAIVAAAAGDPDECQPVRGMTGGNGADDAVAFAGLGLKGLHDAKLYGELAEAGVAADLDGGCGGERVHGGECVPRVAVSQPEREGAGREAAAGL